MAAEPRTAEGDLPKQLFSVRGKSGIYSYYGPEKVNRAEALSKESAYIMDYSKDGKIVCFVDSTGVFIHDCETEQLIQRIEHPNITSANLSPKGTYLLTYERLSKENPQDNLIVWNTHTGEIITKFHQKSYSSEHWPTLKWNDAETVSCRMVTNEVQFYDGAAVGNIAWRLRLQDISRVSLSPGSGPLKVATFVKEKKGAPASVRIFKFPQMEILASKSFFKAQDVDLLWNPAGTALLILTKTDVDTSGKSYYGETGLHFLQADGKFESNIILKKEGPIHDVQWSPSSKEFVIVYGFMPAQTSIFDMKCQPIADLGSNSRNTAQWSPNGRLLCVAGFGNLQGYMDFWDVKKLRKIGTAQADCSAHYEWSPDSRHMLTAVLSPRIRVDNGFKVWNYDGTLLYEEKFAELYQAAWRPVEATAFPDRPPSPRLYAAVKQAELPDSPAKPAKYVHPNAKFGSGASIKAQEDVAPRKYKPEAKPKEDVPPGFDPTETKAAKRNKKRRNKKKTAGGAQDDNDDKEEDNAPEEDSPADNNNNNNNNNKPAIPTSPPQPEEATEDNNNNTPANPDQDPQKRIKALNKKLRQIEQLKKQQQSGAKLDSSQVEKIKSEKQILAELKQIEKTVPAQK